MAQQRKSESGLGLDLDVVLDCCRTCVTDLKNALKSSADQAENVIEECISTISEKAGQFRQVGTAGKEGTSDAQQIFNDCVSTLQEAVQMGYDSARQALKNMGVSPSTGKSR